jgi:hypothetical protein
MKTLAGILLALTIAGCLMAEKGEPRPDIDALYWATDPGGFGRTEPSDPHKDAGYDPGNPPTTPGEVPDAKNHNWIFGETMDAVRYLDASHVREFEDLPEGITATSVADVFRVGQPTTGNRTPGQQVYSVTPAGFTLIRGAATDGQIAVYIDTSGVVEALDPSDGSQVWSSSPSNILTGAVAIDGRQVYVMGDATSPGLVLLNIVTGAEVARAGSATAGLSALDANGVHACANGNSGFLNNVYFYTVGTAPPVETGNVSHGNPVYDLALDSSKVYYGGARGGGFDVRANILSTRAAAWTSTLPTTGSPLIGAIETDGVLVYVGTTRIPLAAGGNANLFVLAAGGNANLFVLQATDGAVVATADVQTGGSTDNVVRIAIDGKSIFCTLDGTTSSVIEMRMQAPSIYQVGLFPAITTGWAADGVGLVADDGAGNAERYFFMDHPVTFINVNGSDNARRPFMNRALPMR